MGGKLRRMNFGQNAWFEFCRMHNCELSEATKLLFDAKNPSALRDLIYCGLLVSDRAEMKDINYNEFTVGEWIDQLTQDELTRIFNVLLSGSSDEKPVKKKAVGKSR